jgi:hypothetical protein
MPPMPLTLIIYLVIALAAHHRLPAAYRLQLTPHHQRIAHRVTTRAAAGSGAPHHSAPIAQYRWRVFRYLASRSRTGTASSSRVAVVTRIIPGPPAIGREQIRRDNGSASGRISSEAMRLPTQIVAPEPACLGI